jgi:hypothetical protein
MGGLGDFRLESWSRRIKDRELFSDSDFLSSCSATGCDESAEPGSLIEHLESEAFQVFSRRIASWGEIDKKLSYWLRGLMCAVALADSRGAASGGPEFRGYT